MTGDEYVTVLVARRDAWETAHPSSGASWVRPLLEWFIEPGDEALVTLPAPSRRVVGSPRVYRTAEALRAEREAVDARIARLSASAALPDRAAAHGAALGAVRTARHQARADRALARVAELYRRRSVLDGRIARAVARESAALTAHRTPDARELAAGNDVRDED